MKRLIDILTILLFASTIALCSDPQGKPDLIIESVHFQWIPIVYGPGHLPQGGDPKVRGIFTLLIRNIGQGDFQDAFYIKTTLPRVFGSRQDTYHTRVNSAMLPIQVGDALPVEISLPSNPNSSRAMLVTFVILDEIFDPYNKIKITLNDSDMTNNSFEYRVGQEDK
jgi:hypothetical protein